MSEDYSYMQTWLERYPNARFDQQEPVSINNFDWTRWSNNLRRKSDMLFFAFTQYYVNPSGNRRYNDRAGYSKDGLKADHCKRIITEMLGNDLLRGSNDIKRITQRNRVNLQAHIKNQANRIETLTSLLDKIYKQYKPLMDERTRRIAQRQRELNNFLQRDDLENNPRILNQREFALKQAQELEKNYLQVAKKRRGYIYRGGSDDTKWVKWYDEELDYQIKTINTTQDTPKMIAEFISKITKVVDYDRIYLFPCVNTEIPSALSNMVRNDKKNKYNFNPEISPTLASFRRANKGQGAVIIIPAGYSLPPLKLKHFYLLGDDSRDFWKDKVKNTDQRGYYYGSSVNVTKYIPDIMSCFTRMIHDRGWGGGDRFAIEAIRGYYYGANNFNATYGSKGLGNLLTSLWTIFKGHSIYPSQYYRWEEEKERQKNCVSPRGEKGHFAKASKIENFYWNLTLPNGYVPQVFIPREGDPQLAGYQRSQPYLIWRMYRSRTRDVAKWMEKLGVADVRVGSEAFKNLLMLSVSDEYRRTIKSSMYDNQYIEISTRGAIYTMNYLVSGVPIYQDTK
tara:strand:+ start:10794 stop:12488 length:1695 start_codon:yes stop_codon:yes gene_type:complete